MKNLTSAVQAALALQYGSEPVNIIAIQWVDNGSWHKYADKELPDLEISGRIQEIGTLESVIKLDGASQTQGISVKLGDEDGTLKDIIDHNDPHGRPVKVQQWYEGMDIVDAFQLYEGEINSPLSWSEGDRTLSFNVVTKLADNEIGFSPEEGYFPNLPYAKVGVPWPLVFGTSQNVPAQSIEEIPTSQLANDVGVPDPSIPERIKDLEKRIKELRQMLEVYYLALAQAEYTADYGDTEAQRQYGASTAATISSNIASVLQQIAAATAEGVSLNSTMEEQIAQARTSLKVLHVNLFQRDTTITLQARDCKFIGKFAWSGEEFTIAERMLSHYTWTSGDGPTGYTHIPAGTKIQIYNNYPIQYVVNLLPSTVHHVQAMKTTDNGQILARVPTSYYTTETRSIGSYTVTLVIFDRPLSSIDTTFGDDIWVTQTSTIGPNTVDILEWLIETYTNLTCDPTTFAHVKECLENYPSHFALLERKNIYQTVEEIAWQARCAIWIVNNTVYLRYLSEEHDFVDTITESDIDVGSLTLTATNTDEIVTKFVALWTDDYAETEANKIILRHNVKKYGTREKEFDFYIYNIQSLVEKSATFWLIRYANVWKNIEFVTHPHKLALETFDFVKFDFDQKFVVNDWCKGELTSLSYDSGARSITVKAWLPVRFGEMEPYEFAWPQDIDIELKFPTDLDITKNYAGGDGPGTETYGGWYIKENEASGVGYTQRNYLTENRLRDQRKDYGDLHPSDLDDIKPIPVFVGTDVTPGDEPTWTYGYPEYNPTLQNTEAESTALIGCYPGVIVSKSEGNTYNVNVYENGLDKDPVSRVVKQLQISDGETIPAGTWVVVIVNRFLQPKTNPQDPNVYESEWSMQTAVWL
jgi:hypothetical protein